MNISQVTILALATYRLTRLWTHDSIFSGTINKIIGKVRRCGRFDGSKMFQLLKSKLVELLTCMFCLSFYMLIIVWFLPDFAQNFLAVWGLTIIIARIEWVDMIMPNIDKIKHIEAQLSYGLEDNQVDDMVE